MGLFNFLKNMFSSGEDESEYKEEQQEEQPNAAPPPITPELIEQIEKIQKENSRRKNPKNSYIFSIVGSYYRGLAAVDRIKVLKPGEKLRLKKDKKNRYSKTALRVFTEDGLWIGYVEDTRSAKIWDDMEGDEGDAEFLEEVHDVNDYYFTDKDGVEHERTYDNGYSYRAFYIIPNYEEKQTLLKQQRDDEKALKELQTPDGRLEPVADKYIGMTVDMLKKERKRVVDQMRRKRKALESGQIADGPFKELIEIQLVNLEKTIPMIEEAIIIQQEREP